MKIMVVEQLLSKIKSLKGFNEELIKLLWTRVRNTETMTARTNSATIIIDNSVS